MSHLFFVTGVLCSQAPQLPSPAEVEPTEGLFLSLESAVARLQAQSPRMLLQKESVRRALERSNQVRSELLPQFSLSATQTRQRYGNTFGLGALSGNPRNNFGARVEARQVLFDGVKYSEFKAARVARDVAEFDFEVAREDLVELTAQLYYTQLRDLQRIEIVASNLERDRALLELARRQFEAGVAIQLDITRAEVRVATQQRLLMEAHTQAADSSLQLKSLLDFDLDQELRLDRSSFDSLMAGSAVPTDTQFSAQAEQRPELRAQRMALRQAQIAQRTAKWERLPKLEAFGEWGYDSTEIFDQQEQEAWLVGLSISVPIFEGGRIAAQRRAAQALVRQNEYRLRELENEVKREFRFSRIDMDSRRAQIAIAEAEVRLGQAEVAQAEERYRKGLADNRALIDGRQALSDAENSHLQAAYLYALSRVAFARATGDVERFFE